MSCKMSIKYKDYFMNQIIIIDKSNSGLPKIFLKVACSLNIITSFEKLTLCSLLFFVSVLLDEQSSSSKHAVDIDDGDYRNGSYDN